MFFNHLSSLIIYLKGFPCHFSISSFLSVLGTSISGGWCWRGISLGLGLERPIPQPPPGVTAPAWSPCHVALDPSNLQESLWPPHVVLPHPHPRTPCSCVYGTRCTGILSRKQARGVSLMVEVKFFKIKSERMVVTPKAAWKIWPPSAYYLFSCSGPSLR